MRESIALALICLAAALGAALLSAGGEQEAGDAAGGSLDDGIRFTALLDGSALETDMAGWLPGVVAGEMPASFEPEALRAQAVAARTYILSRAASGSAAHPDAAVCDDPACCKAHLTDAELRANWGENYAANMAKIRAAVEDTDGLCLVYEGEPIEAVFHSSSAGMTEDSGALWGERPYLVSVMSPETAQDVPGYVTSVLVPEDEFAGKILSERPEASLEGGSAFWLGGIKNDASGRVESAEIGGAEFTGQELRELFGLRSTAFTLDRTDEGFLFTVTGYGHGVGMSQYGANVMAGDGAGYEEILAHYYPGTELAAWTSI